MFYQREAEFLQREEWASTSEDILERRTKHWLHLTPGQKQAFSDWMFTMAKSA
jgi:glycerol-3-phosphate dehydrogenase